MIAHSNLHRNEAVDKAFVGRLTKFDLFARPDHPTLFAEITNSHMVGHRCPPPWSLPRASLHDLLLDDV
jgi:hypothetical protein